MESPRSVSSVESRSRVPPSITGLSREELEKTTQTLLKRLKQKDKELKEYEKRRNSVAESRPDNDRQGFLREKSELEAACAKATNEKEAAEQQSKELSSQVDVFMRRLEECEMALTASLSEKQVLTGKLREIQDLDDALQMQVTSLKSAMQTAMEERDASFSRLGEERDRRMELESLLSDAQQQLRENQTEIQKLQADALESTEIKNTVQEQDMQKQDSQSEVISQQRTEELETELKKKECEILELQRELQELQATCNEAMKSKDDALHAMEEAMAQLEASQGSKEETKAVSYHQDTMEVDPLSNQLSGKGSVESVPAEAEVITDLENRTQKHEATIAHLEEVLNTTQEQLRDKEQDLLKMTQDKTTGHGTVEQLSNEVTQLKTFIQEQSEQCQKFQEAADGYATLDKENTALQEQLLELQEMHASLQSTTDQLHQSIAELEAQLNKEKIQTDQLGQEKAEMQSIHTETLSNLQMELKHVQKSRHNAEDQLEQLEKELTQHKGALNRTSSKLEEESQSHRITRQRLNDEQETSRSLKQQLQEALSRMQASEVEIWKKQESIIAQQKENEDIHLKEKNILESEIQSLKETIASHEKQLSVHEEEMEKLKEVTESEKDKLKKAVVEVKKRLDRASAQLKKTELEGSELQISHYVEKEKWMSEVSHHQHQAEKLAVELKDYKTRAHLLVKTKDEELNALKTEIQHRADVEVDLKVLREKFDDLAVERDNLREELNQANERFQVHLDDLVADFQNQIQEKTVLMLDAQSQKEELQRSIQEWQSKSEKLQETIRLKTDELVALEDKQRAPLDTHELENLQQKCQSYERELKNLKEEFSAYRKTTEQMSEVQQLEMSRLIQSNLELRRQTVDDNLSTLSHRMSMDHHSFKDLPTRTDAFQFSDLLQQPQDHPEGYEDGESLSESQIVALANKQAEREDTFHLLKKQNDQLHSEIEDLEKELELHREQEAVLKSALREADQLKQQMRTEAPENMDFQYLKNTVIKLMTTGEAEALLPVFGKLLNFTEDENRQLTASIQDLKRKREEEAAGTSALLSTWTEWWT